MPNTNAGNLELALSESALARQRLDIAGLTQATTTREDLLPYLAQASAVPYWNSALSRQEKIQLIEEAPRFYDLAGTAAAIDKALSLLGLAYTLTPWYEIGDPPHTARLTIKVDRDIGADTNQALKRLIARLIELRDAIDINLVIEPRVTRNTLSVLRTSDVIRITPT